MTTEKSRECTVRIISRQIGAEGEEQAIETMSKGQLTERDGVLYVLYEEFPEEGQPGAAVKNLLKIEGDPARASLKKSGAVSWRIVFERGKTDASEYRTPYGALGVSVRTNEVTILREKEKTSLQLVYTLFIQGEKQADCRLEAEIR